MPTPFKTRRGGIATQIVPPGELYAASSGNTARLMIHVEAENGRGQLGTIHQYELSVGTLDGAERLQRAVHARAFDVVLASEQSPGHVERLLCRIKLTVLRDIAVEEPEPADGLASRR